MPRLIIVALVTPSHSHVRRLALPPLPQHFGGHVAECAVMGALDVGLVKAHLGGQTKVRDL